MSQIANLKAALARKEGEPDYSQHLKFSRPEPYENKASGSSPFDFNREGGDIFSDHSSQRQPMGDVGNVEVVRIKVNFLNARLCPFKNRSFYYTER